MKRSFNITGACNPQEHYMVNLDSRLAEIKKMVDAGKYFVINRGRQYGKTTALKALKKYLQGDYTVISFDFQKDMSELDFKDENNFSISFAYLFVNALKKVKTIDMEIAQVLLTQIDFWKERYGLSPSSPTYVSYPCGSVIIKSCTYAFLQAVSISSCTASSFAIRILFAIVSRKSCVS